MRPLDLYTEKQIRDGSPDKIASSKLMREVNSVALLSASHEPLRHSLSSLNHPHARIDALKQKDDPNARDKMAFMSIALCSPMMLLGMGAMMAGADELKMLEGDSEAVAKANRNENLRRAAAEKAKEQAKKVEEMLEVEPPKLSLSMPPEKDWAKEREARIRNPIAQYGRAASMQDQVGRPRRDVNLKISKLIKEKQALVDLMESLRGKAQLSEVSAILSRVEILDKSLKQLGC